VQADTWKQRKNKADKNTAEYIEEEKGEKGKELQS
jgi:hypothetical protein